MRTAAAIKTLESVISLLESPAETWTANTNTLRHHETGLEVWIGNGQFGADTYPVNLKPSWNMRRKLWRAVEVAKSNIINRQLSSKKKD